MQIHLVNSILASSIPLSTVLLVFKVEILHEILRYTFSKYISNGSVWVRSGTGLLCIHPFIEEGGGGGGGVIFPGMGYYCLICLILNSPVYSVVDFLVMVDENASGVVGNGSY